MPLLRHSVVVHHIRVESLAVALYPVTHDELRALLESKREGGARLYRLLDGEIQTVAGIRVTRLDSRLRLGAEFGNPPAGTPCDGVRAVDSVRGERGRRRIRVEVVRN